MNDQITMEDVQAMVGRVTFNYEMQLAQLNKVLKSMQEKIASLESPDTKVLKEVK